MRTTAWLLIFLILIGQQIPLSAAGYLGQVTFNGLPVPGATVTALSAGCRHDTARSDIEGRADPVQRPDRPNPAGALRLSGNRGRSNRTEGGILAGANRDRAVRAGVLTVAACVCAVLAHAQTSNTFEVASISREATPRNYVRLQPAGQHFRVEGASAAVLIRYAYDVKDFQLAGGPDWIYDRNDQFKIEATFEGDGRIDRIREMVRGLLASRFQLRVHTDNREGPLFELVVARGGSKAAPSKEDNATRRGCLPYPADCTDVSMADFADYLSAVVLSGVVIDRTGLAGRYDLKVSWSPDNTQFRGNGGTGFFSGAGPSLFTALQEQAGLQLRPAKGNIPTLVVDSISTPTEN